MRHFLQLVPLALPVGSLAPGMGVATTPALLVTPPRLAPAPAPRCMTALPRAVALATVTPGADV